MGFSIARNIVERHPTIGVEDGGDHTDWSLKPVSARGNPTQVVEAGDDSNGPVTAHPKKPHVVEEEDTTEGIGLCWGEEQGSHKDIRPPGLIDDRGAVVIKAIAKLGEPFRAGTRSKGWTAREHQTGRFTPRVGINDLDRNPRRRRRRHGLEYRAKRVSA